jgi:hypothetical protein
MRWQMWYSFIDVEFSYGHLNLWRLGLWTQKQSSIFFKQFVNIKNLSSFEVSAIHMEQRQ